VPKVGRRGKIRRGVFYFETALNNAGGKEKLGIPEPTVSRLSEVFGGKIKGKTRSAGKEVRRPPQWLENRWLRRSTGAKSGGQQ